MSSFNPFHEDDIELMLIEAGVANNCGHYEGGAVHTAITSREELKKLIDTVYNRGFRDGRNSVPVQSRFG